MTRLAAVLLFVSCAATLPEPKTSSEWNDVALDCRSGDARACYWVAISKSRGGDREGAEKDTRALCERGLAIACNQAGFYDEKKAPAEALASWKKSCERGSKDGCDSYGTGLRTGIGGPVDFAAAVIAYEKACALKDSAGCTNLGRLLATGQGVTANPARAITLWAEVCASAEPWQACDELGRAHLEGVLVPRDVERGLGLLRGSCAGGSLRGCFETGHALHELSRNAEAVRYLRTSCDSYSHLGCTELIETLAALGDEDSVAEAQLRKK